MPINKGFAGFFMDGAGFFFFRPYMPLGEEGSGTKVVQSADGKTRSKTARGTSLYVGRQDAKGGGYAFQKIKVLILKRKRKPYRIGALTACA
jgi:hypothetical protein